MPSTYLSNEQLALFHQNGFVIIKDFCSKEEVDKLYNTAVNNKANKDGNLFFQAEQRKKSAPAQWFEPGNDIFGSLERSEKVVETIGDLLSRNSPVCYVHSRLMEKKSGIGGVWEWHQDFAYWQTNKFKSADQMASVMVALTPTNKENGCSQIIKGSHKLGTLKHRFEGNEVGADQNMVNNALKTMELVYAELEAGDALFFHSNLLHRSEANMSGVSSWYNISSYSLQSNLEEKQIFTSWHTPVQVVNNQKIMEFCTEQESIQTIPLNSKLSMLIQNRLGISLIAS